LGGMIREVGEQWVGFLEEVRGLVGERGDEIWRNPRDGVGAVKDGNGSGLRAQQGNDNLRGLYLDIKELRSRTSVPRPLRTPVDGRLRDSRTESVSSGDTLVRMPTYHFGSRYSCWE